MRITVYIMLMACLQVSAHGYGQTITLSETNVSLNEVFPKIEKQSGYLFWYNDALLHDAKRINISVKDATLQQVLDICFSGQPFTYELIDKMVVLKARPAPSASIEEHKQPLMQPLMQVHGQVMDSVGAPLAGASVTIKGTTKGTRTNLKGEFDMNNVRQGTILVISYTGYVNKEIALSTESQVYIILQRSQSILDATVIQAYGTTSRRFSVGAISTVDATTIEKQPVMNVLLALQGQVPGLAINSITGAPGGMVQVQVRGQNTLSSASDLSKPFDQPLFIVDGVPWSVQNNPINRFSSIAVAGSSSGGVNQPGGISSFNGINPLDIESVTVLRDADATSIYGTQGSNGVILITTKKGRPGKTSFNLAANTGFNTAARPFKLLNTQQYLTLRKEAFQIDGVTPGLGNQYGLDYAPDLLVFDQNKYTDWQKVIFGKTSNNTDIHASLSGGTYNNTFLVSAGYSRSDFNYPGNYYDQELSLHANTHHQSTDNRLTIDFGTDYSYGQNNSSAFGGGNKILMAPNLPDLIDPAGNLVWSYKGVNLNNSQFYQFLKIPEFLNTYTLNTSLRLGYKIFTGLSFSANLGYSRLTTKENQQSPAAAFSPAYVYRDATFANTNAQTINIEPQLDYNVSWGKGVLTALAGATYKKSMTDENAIDASGYASDDFLGSVNGATNIYTSDNSTIYKYTAGFARIKYVYDQKYILSLTGRRDGSSNFGPGHQFGSFGSVGAGWIFSEEKGFKKMLPFVSYAKLFGNYGTNGTDGIGPYLYQASWKPVSNSPAFEHTQPNAPLNLYNPDFSWSLKKSLNLSLDLGFLKDRLLLNASWYRSRELQQLTGYPLPAQVGFSSVLENSPAGVQNQGWEFVLTGTPVRTTSFSWSANFNISFNRNKLISFPNLENSSYYGKYVIGRSVSEVYGYRYKGVNPATGLFEFYTAKGEVTNSPNYQYAEQGGDQVPIADQEIKFMGGFGNTFSYKHFSLYVFFQFAGQTAPNWLYSLYTSQSGAPGSGVGNVPVEVLNLYWNKPGDHATIQRLTTTYGDAYTTGYKFTSSSGAYSDDTYVRLKTVNLSYSLPEGWLRKLHMHDSRIYIAAQNLLTFTNVKVTDPEQFGSLTNFPLQRTVACGLSFNF